MVEDQVYLNKQIIIEVMKIYAFLRDICFIAKRSSSLFWLERITFIYYNKLASYIRNDYIATSCNLHYNVFLVGSLGEILHRI